MTTKELIGSFYDSLISDERILSPRERDLLANLLKKSAAIANGEGAAVKKTIVQAVGEIVGQRAYETLGENVVHRLLEQQLPFYANPSDTGNAA